MAAATVSTTSRPHYEGDLKYVFRKYTALADTNTDTWPVGSNIVGINVVQQTSSASVTATVAANVITYNVSAGTPDTTVQIIFGPQ